MKNIFSFSELIPSALNQPDQEKPLLSTGDFNGDGIVNFGDIARIFVAASLGIDDAVYDLNADGEVNSLDVWQTVDSFGQTSSLLDQQLMDIYNDIDHLFGPFGIGLAALDYAPFTQTFSGHGAHWVSLERIDSVLNKDQADWTHEDYIGLNVSPAEDGFFSQEVLGVFYLLPPPPEPLEDFWQHLEHEISDFLDGEKDIISWHSGTELEIHPLDLFADDPLTNHVENWHIHEQVYIRRSLENPLDSTAVNYQQNVTDTALTQLVEEALISDERVLWGIETPNGFEYSDIRYATDIILPKFGMMHVWVNELSSDPFGVFAETNEDVAVGYPELPGSHHHVV